MFYELGIPTSYFHEPLLFQIFVPWKFIFTFDSDADNHFYKYTYLFQILYHLKSVFLLKYMLRFFIFKFDLNVKHHLYFFQRKTMIYGKKKHYIKKIKIKILLILTQKILTNGLIYGICYLTLTPKNQQMKLSSLKNQIQPILSHY